MAAPFDAFISYSRRESTTLASELQSGLERFAKPWHKLRAVRVFRDDASMSANTGLWSTIERALTEAAWFILLVSPGSAASAYVSKEIEWWLAHKSADRILLVLDEGEILWDAAAGDFDWERSRGLNRALAGAFPEEPRWVDLSWFELHGSLGTADPRWNERVADVAAAVRFAERDELIGVNVREHRRARRLLRAGIATLSGLLVASLVATGIAVAQANEAAAQARVALARQLAAQALALAPTDVQLASLLAVEALRMDENAQTEAALFQLATASPHLVRSLPAGAEVEATAVGSDGAVLVGAADGTVAMWEGSERRVVLQLPGAPRSVAMTADRGIVVATDGSVVAVATTSTVGELTGLPTSGELVGDSLWLGPSTVALAPDGAALLVSDRFGATVVFAAGAGGFERVGAVPYGGHLGVGDGEATVVDLAGRWARIALADGAVIDSGEAIVGMRSPDVVVSGDGSTIAGATGRIDYSVWHPAASGSEPDAVASASVASAELALSVDGGLLALAVDGAIHVAEVRVPDALPEPPLVLTGAGELTFETLAFGGDRFLVSGSGDNALVWDLEQSGRMSVEFAAPVPDSCTACGPPFVAVSPDARHALLSDRTGVETWVVDLADGSAVDLSGIEGAAWLDAGHIVGMDWASGELVVRGGSRFAEIRTSVPLEPGDSVLTVAARGGIGGRATYLTRAGLVGVVDLGLGEQVRTADGLVEALGGSDALTFGVAPDGSSAFVESSSAEEGRRVHVLRVATGDVAVTQPGTLGAAYDAESGLRVFADGRMNLVDPGTGEFREWVPADVDDVPPVVLDGTATIAVTGGTDGAVTLVDLTRWGAVLGTLTVPVEENRYAVSGFSHDGLLLVTAIQQMDSIGRAPVIRTLSLDPADWVAAACAVAGRDLTVEEWSRYTDSTPPADLRCRR